VSIITSLVTVFEQLPGISALGG